MTGEQFLNKVRAMKNITDIHWYVEGDVLSPELVKVVVIADGEEIKIIYPEPIDLKKHIFMQNCAIALIINKFMEQIGSDYRVCQADNLAKAINHSRQQLVK